MIVENSLFLRSLALVMLVTLSACTTKLIDDPQDISSLNDVEAILAQARQSSGEMQANLLFRASELLVAANEMERALDVLQVTFEHELNPKFRAKFHVLYALSLAEEFPGESAKILADYKTAENFDTTYQFYYYLAKTKANIALENGIEAFDHALKLEAFSQSSEIKWQEYVWQALMLLDDRSLRFQLNTVYDTNARAWLALALDYKLFGTEPDKLLQAFARWRASYPDHSASKNLPSDLLLAEKAQPYDTSQIALLLPSKGPYAGIARVIRDGFMSVYYETEAVNRPYIRVYDTTETHSVITLYEQAISEGAKFIIGPLTKERIEELVEYYPEVPTPTLVLNRLDNLMRGDEHFYQFGLPIEDEAKQVAVKAFKDGKRNAAILTPKTQAGDRAATSFEEEFSALGGKITAKYSFDPDKNHQAVVKELLGIDRSELRKNTLRYLLDRDLEFQARRRQDADFIFLSSKYKDARQIKPFLNYYYAQDLDVYATSEVYSGKPSSKDKDLNQIQFCDIPWLVNPSPKMEAQRKKIEKLWPNATQRQARLYALGADSYRIMSELSKLRAFPLYRIPGFSGRISVNSNGWVVRELSWAKFRKSKVVPL